MNIYSIKETLCDNYCKYPHLCDGEEELMKHCDKCEVCATLDELEETLNATIAGQLTLQEALIKAHDEAKKEFAEELIYKIVNTPTKFESTYYMYREGIAFRQNEIIDIIKEMAGDGT